MNKKTLLICICCVITMKIFSQPLFTYGGNVVTKDEFLRAYRKNMGEAVNKEQALKEYLDLYSKFKLKVKLPKI